MTRRLFCAIIMCWYFYMSAADSMREYSTVSGRDNKAIMRNKEMVSIVIPHFNTPDLLQKLLDTIPADPLFQIIVVDDKSSEHLEELAALRGDKAYERVLFLDNTTDKKGAGVCRNIGLAKAEGEWLLFADSDDYFLPDLKETISPYLTTDADMVYFMPTSVQLDTGRPASRHLAYKQLMEAYLKKKTPENLCSMMFNFVTPWSKLIRREIAERDGITFDEIAVANDVMFMTKCCAAAKKVLVDEKEIYCVTRAAKTLTTKKDEAKFDLREDVFLRRYAFAKQALPRKQLRAVHLNRIAVSHMMNALIYGYGIKKVLQLYVLYKKNRIPLLDAQLFNPFVMIPQAMTFLAWRREDKKYQ